MGEEAGRPDIVSDFVEGVDLANGLNAKFSTFREAATCEALRDGACPVSGRERLERE